MAIQFLNTVAVDTDVLYVDTSSNRVGIGEPNPDYELHVDGQIYSKSSTFPVYFLQRETSITGDGTFTTTGGIASGFHLRTNSSGTIQNGFGGGIVFSLTDSGTASNTAARIYARRDGGNTTGALQFWGGFNGNSPLMTMRASGTVGIGTTSPAQKLDVNGNLAISGTTFVDSTRRNIYLNSFAGGGANGIFFRDGFTYNASITAEDHSGSGADGICISGYDGVSFSTGSNTKNERMRIGSAGQIGIGGANYGTSGQVLTSSGSSSAPSWQTPTAGDITGVTAGSYMTGGGTSGTVTLNANASTSATANTLAARDGSGDINVRLLRANYANQSTISGAMAFRVNNGSDNYTRYCSNPTAIRTFIGAGNYNDIRSLGVPSFTNGTNPNITTAQVMSEIESDGGFDSYSSVFKTSWSYAGNYNLTDAGDFTETAGSSWITWTDNSSDSTRGNITALAIAPNTGGSAGGVFIYNDQGPTYSPGWRQVWTSTTDGSGSGLDADLLDGFQTTASGNRWGVVPTIGSSGVLEAGKYIDFHDSDSHTGDYNYRITSSGGRLYLSGDLEVDGGDIYINDSNTRITEGSSSSIRLQTNNGYLDIGAQNSSHAHFDTDRSNFYFSKQLQVNTGIIRSYDEDLNLNRAGSGTARLRITSGTTISDQALQSASTVRSQFNSGDYSQLESNGSGGVIKALSSGSTNVLFRAYGDSYTLNDFGIGTSSPSARLSVENTTSTTSSAIVRIKSLTVSNGPFLRIIDFIRSNNSMRGYIAMNPYAVQYNTTSDYRLKRNVTPMENSIDRIKLLKPSRFNWVEGPDDYVVDGFIAHEVQDVVHEAVSGEKDAVDKNNEPSYQGIDQSKLVPLLTAALQDAITKIENLETRIQTLESN